MDRFLSEREFRTGIKERYLRVRTSVVLKLGSVPKHPVFEKYSFKTRISHKFFFAFRQSKQRIYFKFNLCIYAKVHGELMVFFNSDRISNWADIKVKTG